MRFALLPLATLALVSAPAFVAPPPPALALVETIPLPGVTGRFDHFALDREARRLFVAALGNDTLEVLDLRAGKRLKSVGAISMPTGVVYLSDRRRIGVASGGAGRFELFEGEGLSLASAVSSLADADNVRWDAEANRVYVGFGEGALAVIDPETAKLLASVPLPAHPESFQLESKGNRIFVNTPGAGSIAVIDRARQALVATWPLKDAAANFPMALDEDDARLFVGCRRPPTLLVLDTATGNPVSHLSICGDTDDLFYDRTRKRLYVSCGEGLIDVIDQKDPDRYSLRESIPTRAGARTSFYSADSDELYLAVPARGSQEAEIRVYQPR
jgi:DNA-binding beta-propeller fold protein YncE